MTIQPGDDTAAGKAGRGHLRASHADREQVICTLKAAFVQGMLAKDELDARVGHVLASRTYADLAAVTADIPAGVAESGRHGRPDAGPDHAAARPDDGGGNRALCRRVGVHVPPALAHEFGGRTARCGRCAVLVEHPRVPIRFALRCGECGRLVAGEALRWAATAGASIWRGRSGIPAPGISRPGQAASASRSRSPAHGRSCTDPSLPPASATGTPSGASAQPAGPVTGPAALRFWWFCAHGGRRR